ncbi:unnamed protein product [Protopolystoma xenopodis]|uniref:Uncharacterized protein n=1 Tax=Protopolystoma xenopodis TaxID=117903 RepID=A0A3S5BEI9_9PLAT|nr:unnamed protein product [Protopolystoma xenopodis]
MFQTVVSPLPRTITNEKPNYLQPLSRPRVFDSRTVHLTKKEPILVHPLSSRLGQSMSLCV